MAAGEGLSLRKCNQVQQEQIWKDYVHHEEQAGKRWLTTWGFLTQHYNQMQNDILRIRGQPKMMSQDKDPPLKLPKIDPTFGTKVSKVPFVPLKTSQEVGWRSGRPEHKLEVYGRWGRPKKSILKHFNWTIYACD